MVITERFACVRLAPPVVYINRDRIQDVVSLVQGVVSLVQDVVSLVQDVVSLVQDVVSQVIFWLSMITGRTVTVSVVTACIHPLVYTVQSNRGGLSPSRFPLLNPKVAEWRISVPRSIFF